MICIALIVGYQETYQHCLVARRVVINKEVIMRELLDCVGCVYSYTEKESDWWECTHENYNPEEGICPGRVSRADLRLTPEERKEAK